MILMTKRWETAIFDSKGQGAHFVPILLRCVSQMALPVCNGCSECWLRCAEGVQATRQEWDALQAYLASCSEAESAYVESVLHQDKTVDLGDEVTVTMCRFFDRTTRRCAIYPVRPLVCRLLGHVEWMPCPIEKVPHILPAADALALMEAYCQFERRTFAQWETQSDLEQTDLSER